MNIQLYDTATICSAYVCAIEYGDFTGLSDNDEDLVNNWLDTLPDGCMFQYSDESEFAMDNISGLMADCLEVTIYAQLED